MEPETNSISDAWRLFELTRAGEWEGLDGYLDRMLSLCAELFGASGASIFLGHEGCEEFELAGTCGTLSRVPLGAKLRRGEGIAGIAIRNEKPMLVLDPLGQNALNSAKIARREDIGSSMVIPLLTPLAGCFGVLNLARVAGTDEFNDLDLARAESIAAQIALAVSNARLFVKTNMVMSDLRSLSEKLQSVVSSVGVGLIVVDRAGTVLECNPMAESVLGPAAPGVSWNAFAQSAPIEFRAKLSAAIDAALHQESRVEQIQNEAGTRFWSLISTVLESGGATVAIQEVTEHELARRDVSRLERLAEIGQMTAAIAHEIRNPLTGIRASAQILQSSPEEAPEIGKIIESEVLKLNNLCEQFLEFARPITIQPQNFDLVEAVEGVIASERAAFEAVNVDLLIELPATACSIHGDAAKTEQVCRNLIRNAREACADGGTVVVRVSSNGVEVEDDGLGMTEEDQKRLFTPFFTTKAHGTGLGLCNVRKIIDAMDADILVASTPGGGTRFSVSFDSRQAA